MTNADYVRNWTRCLKLFGINNSSPQVKRSNLNSLSSLTWSASLDAIFQCVPEKTNVLRQGEIIYGSLLGCDVIERTWLTVEMIEFRLIPIFSYLSGDFLLISFGSEKQYKCRWLHSRFFYYKEDGLSRFLSDWHGYPWEILQNIKRKGRFYWDDVDIESWSD
jgi:hypothetical protein